MKKVLFSLVAIAVLSNGVFAKTSTEVSNDALSKARIEAKDNEVHVVKDAVKALFLTKKVLVDINKNDKKTAIKDLEDAIGKLEVALSAEKAPKLLPVDARVKAVEYVGSANEIKQNIKTLKDLISDGKIQEARKLINTLQSEIDVISVNLPVATYPDALKLAAKYLHEGKVNQAQSVLLTALNTLVEDVYILPIPILKANALIEASSKIAKKDKDQAIKHLENAKIELEKAELLGYTSKSDVTYKSMNSAIEKIKKEIKGKNKAEKMFENLIKNIKSFKDKIIK